MTILASMLVWMAVGVQGPAPVSAPLRPGWLVLGLPDGVELRYRPLVVTLKDYPKAARRNDEQGTSLLRLQVTPSGQLASCTTARSSGSPVLDAQACQLYRARGRFELRGAKQPVTLQAPVAWKLID
jgi:TonB family protein